MSFFTSGAPFNVLIEEFKGEYRLHHLGFTQRQWRPVLPALSKASGRGTPSPMIIWL